MRRRTPHSKRWLRYDGTAKLVRRSDDNLFVNFSVDDFSRVSRAALAGRGHGGPAVDHEHKQNKVQPILARAAERIATSGLIWLGVHISLFPATRDV